MSKKMTVLLAGTLVASLVAAGFALTMNLGISSSTVLAPPVLTTIEQPIVHARPNTIHKRARGDSAQLNPAQTVVLPSPGAPPTPGVAGSTAAPRVGGASREVDDTTPSPVDADD